MAEAGGEEAMNWLIEQLKHTKVCLELDAESY